MISLLLSLTLAAGPAASVDAGSPQPGPAARGKASVKGKASADAGVPDAGVPGAVAPKRPFRWDIPGKVVWVPSAGPQVSDGVPMDLQLARTDWGLDAVVQYMLDSFRKAGFYMAPLREQRSPTTEPMLTALDVEKLVAYTVIFQENADRSVTLILGTSDMSKYTPPGATLGWAPLMPGSEQVTRSDLEGAHLAVFAAKPGTTQAQVFDYYRTALKPVGYAEDPDEPGLFRRGSEVLKVSTRDEEGLLMVSLRHRQGGGAAPRGGGPP
ncbi:hypothetical protein [Corallococcus sicarius]|uniref:Uncharacterized protein n=1 Tax=Corallococcus sicarius TaxID=2316726 RepID=A0A3A8NB24_9BACT|nr:hypothetical protein [Corallococcus sicarius]RKH41506.1 hypothetical protein D7X12_18050 [Corallococcus sicarius]